MTLTAGTQIGKYVVRRKIAEGGMAEIYLAASVGPEGFHKDVVIKRVRPMMAGDPDFVEMFVAEARVASKIGHANVVQIFDFDKHEDTYYLAMEYVRGRSLWDLRRRAKERMDPMPPLLVAQIGLEVARALQAAHTLSIGGQPVNLVHRDVTPHNILLSYEGAVKLTDFGIAKAGNRLTAAGVLKGKFAYMSPEQARGEPVDHRTDLFALGIVLWELLTGGRLFEGDSDIAVLRSVQQSAIAPPRRLNPDVAPELDDAVMKALSRDPETRFQSARDFERALLNHVLTAAKSYEDTDVGAYVRRLFADEQQAELAQDQEPLPAPSIRVSEAQPALSPTANHRPGEGFSGTFVLSGSQRAVVSEPPPPPAQALGSDAPIEPTFVTQRPAAGDASGKEGALAKAGLSKEGEGGGRKSSAQKWPLVVGGTALAAALALVGLRTSRGTQDGEGAGRAEAQTTHAVPTKANPGSAPPAITAPGGIAESGRAAGASVPGGGAPTGETSAPPAPVTDAAGSSKGAASLGKQGVPADARTPAAGAPPPAAPAKPAYGTVVLKVIPWAHLWVDGVKQPDVERPTRLHLSPGKHTLRLSQKHGAKTFPIVLAPGATKVIHYNALVGAQD